MLHLTELVLLGIFVLHENSNIVIRAFILLKIISLSRSKLQLFIAHVGRNLL
jgi:hypothetical protein